MNLIEAILAECNRVRALIAAYDALGPAGGFGAAALSARVNEAEAALGSGDVVRMVSALQMLRECQ